MDVNLNKKENFMNNGNNYQQNPYETTYREVETVIQKEEPSKGSAIKSMIFGIIAAYFAWIPFVSILGIIFGAIAKKSAKKILAADPANTPTRHFAKAGRITGKIGFIAGIIMTAFWILYFVLVVVLTALLTF